MKINLFLSACLIFALFSCQQAANESATQEEPSEITTTETETPESTTANAEDVWSSEFVVASVEEEAGAPVEAPADAAVYTVDAAKSTVLWKGNKLAEKFHTGTIDLKESSLMVAGDMIQSGTIVLDMNSIKNIDLTEMGIPDKAAKLEGHLKSADFFDVVNFPSATLNITNVAAKEGEENMYEVEGNLTIKDQTHQVTFPAMIDMEGNNLKSTAYIKLERSKWGISFGLLGDLVADDIFQLYFDIDASAS